MAANPHHRRHHSKKPGKLAILGFSQRAGAQDAFLEILYRASKDRGVAVVYVVSRNVDDLGAQMNRLGYTMPAAVAPPSMTPESMGFRMPHRLDGLIVVDRAGQVIYVASSASHNQTCRRSSRRCVTAGFGRLFTPPIPPAR